LRLGMWHVLSNAVPSCCLTSSQASTAVAQPLSTDDVGECGHQWPSAAISGYQWSSAVISGHQWSSVVISGHQWSSVVISCTHLSESKCCLRAVVSLSVRSSAKMVDTFGEASSAFRTSPAGTGVHEDTGVNVNADMGSSHGPKVSSRARGARGPGIGNSRDTAPSGLRTPSRATMGQSCHQGQSRGNK
jgi:hypothetical protein